MAVKNNAITILTLFGGRWHTLEPFLHGLLNLDWPIKNLRLLWYTNAGEQFVECLKMQKALLEKKGYRIDLVQDASLPPSALISQEGGQRTNEHLYTIAALYNAAWQHVETDDVLALEDDVLPPSHAVRRLFKVMKGTPQAAVVLSCVFDRHTAGTVVAWDVVQTPVFGGPAENPIAFKYVALQVEKPWGVRKISAGGLSCTLIRRSRMPAQMRRQHPFKVWNTIPGQEPFSGCDIVFGMEINQYGKEVYADFDVRPLHIDSKARIH